MGVTLEELDKVYQLASVGDRIAIGVNENFLWKCVNDTAWWSIEKNNIDFKGWEWSVSTIKYTAKNVDRLLVNLPSVDPELLWE